MKKLLALLALIALIVGGWYLATPWLAMKGVADAALEGDSAALEGRIDFEALRANANAQITESVEAREGQGGLIDRIGGEVVERIGREVNERALTPEVMGNVVVTGSLAAGFIPERLRGQDIEWDVEREGLDSFRGVGTFEDGTPGPVLLFERYGLGWKMTGFELP